jgi:GNAT superfamily N-acetyltransferase
VSEPAPTTTTLSVEEHPEPADLQRVTEGLRAFNRAIAGEMHLAPFTVFLRDGAGEVVGGLIARLSWGWLYVDKFWIDERHRRRGHGRRMLDAAERFARERGCGTAHLDTFEFQALPFYERQGYVVWGVLEGYPPGYRQFFLRKPLRDADAP